MHHAPVHRHGPQRKRLLDVHDQLEGLAAICAELGEDDRMAAAEVHSSLRNLRWVLRPAHRTWPPCAVHAEVAAAEQAASVCQLL